MESSKKIIVKIVNAFVDNEKGGNPAGIVRDADNLSTDEKLAVASKVGLSETAFISSSKKAAFKLEFFTPTKQIAHCGHATIAAFSYLSQLGEIENPNSSKETIDGTREVVLQDGLAFMEQREPKYSTIERKKVLRSLNLDEDDLIAKQDISIVNTGNAFAIVPVSTPEILREMKPDFDSINKISEDDDLIGYYVFCTQASSTKRDASTRMFAPRYGIKEEAATGMAAGPLASYLHDKLHYKKDRFLIEQGWFMNVPSPSLLIVELTVENERITKIMAGGKGVQINTLVIEI